MAASNKRTLVFFFVIVAIIALFLGWLMLFQPEAVQKEVVREIPNERIFWQ